MAKNIEGYIKLQIPAGQANPSPPVGPALGQRGLNIMEFCKAFNAATDSMEKGMPIPVEITAYSDKSFTFVTKTPPASYFLKKAAKSLTKDGVYLIGLDGDLETPLVNGKECAYAVFSNDGVASCGIEKAHQKDKYGDIF